MKHITENSLLRIAGRPAKLGEARTWACDPSTTGIGERYEHTVIVNEQSSGVNLPIEGVGSVTCPMCRVLADAALERRDVASLIAQVTP